MYFGNCKKSYFSTLIYCNFDTKFASFCFWAMVIFKWKKGEVVEGEIGAHRFTCVYTFFQNNANFDMAYFQYY